MKITNIVGDELAACCKFHYRGFEVSASTIFKPHNVEVCKLIPEGITNPLHRADHIQSAIEWIDATIAAKHRDQSPGKA